MTCRAALRGLERPRGRAQVAAECRDAAAEYEAWAADAAAKGNEPVAAMFRSLAAGRRQRAQELEGGQA